MINYNLAIFENAALFPGKAGNWMFGAVVLFFVIMLAFAIGNYISVKLLKPTHRDLGRVFYLALIWFCTNIVLALFLRGQNLLVNILSLIAFYFETKFLMDYKWGKAIIAVIIPIIVAIIIIGILWFAIPGNLVQKALFPQASNLKIW